MMDKPVKILLIEDNPGDIELTTEAFKKAKIQNKLDVVTDGFHAMAYLKKEGEYAQALTPDIILLDLNLPEKDGREVLKEIKSHDKFKKIPVIILTTSQDEDDMKSAYHHSANCFIRKPDDMHQYFEVVQKIEDFWLTIAKLPKN